MREKIISKALIVLAVFFLPVFITSLFTDFGKKVSTAEDVSITIEYKDGKKTVPLEQYLIGVVAAEMPAQFEGEALKAQAIAARTYTMKRVSDNENIVFKSNIQSYYSRSELEVLWGVNDFALNYPKIQRAVEDTKAQVLVYEDELIDAVFHSSSIGTTRSALQVWGQEIPYLQQAQSLQDINAPTYSHQYSFDYEEVKKKALKSDDQIILTQELSSDLQIIERDTEGYVLQVQLGNKIYTGEAFRKIFGLASSNFSILFKDDTVDIVCKGYGHGVGLSQYGAQAMAQGGATCEEILTHYYFNVKLTTLKEMKVQ
ncbi:MAG: stage II sporulation protein D [Vallitaleaceae bacterium]|nr:stage II sporulation protein D [Vallitaleaceae bacterium]